LSAPWEVQRNAAPGTGYFRTEIFMKFLSFIEKFVRDERGMETVEWGVLAALIVVGLVTAIATLGNNVLAKFNALQNATS
jgi:Flp pilus assembly pilin Flp